MKISAVIPTRGTERKQLVDFALRQIERQTHPIDEIVLVDHEPTTEADDLVERYEIGIKRATGDIIFLWEDDDWYSRHYVAQMVNNWFVSNCPEIFGIGCSMYYNIKELTMREHFHPTRAGACNTLISGSAKDKIQYRRERGHFDIALWSDLKGRTVLDKWISIGIKHNIGKTGGMGHRPNYMTDIDTGMAWLRQTIDKESFAFYRQLHEQLNAQQK